MPYLVVASGDQDCGRGPQPRRKFVWPCRHRRAANTGSDLEVAARFQRLLPSLLADGLSRTVSGFPVH
jgi:hypothetical protein